MGVYLCIFFVSDVLCVLFGRRLPRPLFVVDVRWCTIYLLRYCSVWDMAHDFRCKRCGVDLFQDGTFVTNDDKTVRHSYNWHGTILNSTLNISLIGYS